MNAELIKALRCCGSPDTTCKGLCPYHGVEYCLSKKDLDAADALEAADKRIEELERSFIDVCNANGSLACERNKLLNDVRELEAQQPKEGEWITTRTENHDGEIYCSVCDHDAPTEGDYRQVKTNYCPNCGAKMQTVTDCHTLVEGER